MNERIKIGLLYSRIRVEEKLLIEAFRKDPMVELVLLDDRELIFDLDRVSNNLDLVLERCINQSRALYSIQILEDNGVLCVNSAETADICGSKFLTTLRLKKFGVPTPRCMIAYTEESALRAIENMGYPCVLKPAVGSWGRLLSKVNDREAAEAILEHKSILGSYHHSVFYIQEYVEKENNSDIRAFVIGTRTVGAIYRRRNHWITNTARDAVVENCEVSEELNRICVAAARAVGGGIVAVDLFEFTEADGRKRYSVNEVNYTMEFRNSCRPTGVNIPELIAGYCKDLVNKKRNERMVKVV